MKWQHIALILLLVSAGGYGVYKLTRGIRNKNPGNIRWNPYNDWQGQLSPDDGNFCRFRDAKYGIRAMAKTLQSYQRRGVMTIRDIINTWAPPSENNTQSYVNSVVSRMGVESAEFIPYIDNGDYLELIKSIIHHENGFNPYSDDLIEESIRMAI